MQIQARYISAPDAKRLQEAFAGTPWGRGTRFFEELVSLHEAASRRVWVGIAGEQPVAFGSLVRESTYPAFRERGIPEIHDLNVSPSFRRLGIATSILDLAEHAAFEQSALVGIGFGLHSGYRAAQRLYVQRGYVPDGNGVFYRDRFPQEGEQVILDDHLILYLIKRRPAENAA
jgi:GNAT superfamily N-acetyltransferase